MIVQWQALKSVPGHPDRPGELTSSMTAATQSLRAAIARGREVAAGKTAPGARDNAAMARKNHVSETPATQWLRAQGVAFTEHVYDYVEHGGTAESSAQLGVPEHEVVKTLVMQDEAARPLVVLMHGDRTVSTKNLARAIGAKSVEPCKPEVAQRHSGYLVGGTSPFGFRKEVPVYVQETILALPRILINGGRRGYLVGMPPAVLTEQLRAKPVQCAN
jgi:Cys-tRNA(Pro) deacylase